MSRQQLKMSERTFLPCVEIGFVGMTDVASGPIALLAVKASSQRATGKISYFVLQVVNYKAETHNLMTTLSHARSGENVAKDNGGCRQAGNTVFLRLQFVQISPLFQKVFLLSSDTSLQ